MPMGALPTASQPHKPMKIIHTMVRVVELDRSLQFYETVLGLTPCHRLDFDDFSLVYLRNPESDFEIELTWNRDRAAYTHGDAYGHLAVVTDDLDGEHDRLSALDLEPAPIKEFHADGQLLARFFFIVDPDGYKIEVLARLGHYR